MTKKELKEAIASTIVENGQKAITATALANLLNEIVDAAGSGGTGGVTIFLDFDLETFFPFSEPNEGNANAYQTLAQGLINNIAYPVNCILNLSGDKLATSVEAYNIYTGTNKIEISSMFLSEVFLGSILLNEDGSVEFVEFPTEE